MGSLQDELRTKVGEVTPPPSVLQTPTAAPAIAEQQRLAGITASPPKPNGETQLESVCKEFADRLQPFVVAADKGNDRDLKQALKSLHERVVNARRVAAGRK